VTVSVNDELPAGSGGAGIRLQANAGRLSTGPVVVTDFEVETLYVQSYSMMLPGADDVVPSNVQFRLVPLFASSHVSDSVGPRIPKFAVAVVGRVTVSTADALTPPNDPPIVTVVVAATAWVVTGNVALVAPACRATLGGMVAGSPAVSGTTTPPTGAGAVSVAVPVAALPPTTLDGLRESDASASPVTVIVGDCFEAPLSKALIVAVPGATAVIVTFALDEPMGMVTGLSTSTTDGLLLVKARLIATVAGPLSAIVICPFVPAAMLVALGVTLARVTDDPTVVEGDVLLSLHRAAQRAATTIATNETKRVALSLLFNAGSLEIFSSRLVELQFSCQAQRWTATSSLITGSSGMLSDMITRTHFSRGLALAVLLAMGFVPVPAAPPDPSLFSGLVWRNIGPFRGGRISAVTGAVGQPGVFYAGLPAGGVWKTTSAGETWYPVFDSVKEAASVGAIEVAPSDPNVIYAGMGDLATGGSINEGNGVYKSTDAGKTWQHLGLDETKQIPAILVDPKDPNIVLIAAQGDIHKKSDQRGIFRSADGGKTWKKVLYVDDTTGGQDLAWDYDHPNVMLAMTVRHYTDPNAQRGGAGAGLPAGAPGPQGGRGPGAAAGPTGTSLFKSTDEGQTWKEITGNGLPNPLTGRCAVAVAMNTNSQRMFIIGGFGLYRSDDGGGSWKQIAADDRRIANGQGNYTSGVYVDPKNPDIIYTLATSSYRSLDGGKTFAAFKGAPGGDDPQQMWIDPTDGKRLFLGVDQGATVSLDGGLTWSSWYNQSTAQVYHISTDTQYPYWVYATQQDSGSIGTRSRGNLGAITTLDWMPHPGYEFGSIVADPLNPNITYAGGPSAGIVKTTMPSGQWINVSPNIDTSASLRKVGNQPLIFSPTNPHELFAGFQYLMSTTDGAMHWKKLSPDLTYPKGVTPPPPPPPGTAPGRGGPGTPPLGSIESISPSSVAAGTIWVGTNNGLIKVTRNHGATWDDATIPGLPNPTRADIVAIDASHQDANTAYATIDYHNVGDYKPYVYRTRDGGKTWTAIVTGLAVDQPGGSFARVVRADTKKAGLLFAGTESSMYVSFNDGDNWQSLMLNLPTTSFRDIAIHENDLVIGTYGRGFFVLDDYSPLRQITPEVASEPAHLFKPGDAIRVRRNVNGDTPFPPEMPHAANPPLGAIIYYYLGSKPSATITLDVLDVTGKTVRHLSSAPFTPYSDPPPAVPDFWLEKPRPMPTDVGTNRINWNIRYDNPPAFTHNYAQVMGAVPGDTPASPEGALALPGVYTLKLTVDGKSYTQTVTVKNDPRSPASAADLKAQHDLQMKLTSGVSEASDGYQQVAAMREAVAAILRKNPPAAVADAAKAFDAKLATAGGTTGGGRRGGGGGFPGAAGGPPPPPTFVGVNASLLRQLDTLDFGDMAPNEPSNAIYVVGCTELKKTVANWAAINKQDLGTFNDVLTKNGLGPIAAASPALPEPACAAPQPPSLTTRPPVTKRR